MSEYCSPQNCVQFSDKIDDILCDIKFVKKGKKSAMANVASSFDIEATSFYTEEGEKRATMYAWGFGINGRCIRGRTWGEFVDVIDRIVEYYNLHINKRLIIYVHNLAYEFQWFREYFEWDSIFSIDQRKPVYAVTKNGIEFRCSYILSRYSLEKLGENLTKYKVTKKVGDLNYKLLRHSLTPISETEWGYILSDVQIVMAHIQEEIERTGSIIKLPLTKTGYVRELCRDNCLKGDNRFNYVKMMKTMTLTKETYKQMKRTYMGGFTHANINYVCKIVKNVHSYDFTSSYPAAIVSEKYPMSRPNKVIIKDEKDFLQYINAFCCMFECVFHNIESKVSFDNYISISRCMDYKSPIINNGRVVEADYVKVAITEQDFLIIEKMYDWDYMEISNFYFFYTDYLPKDIIETTLTLYNKKTELKGVAGKEIEYLVSKEMVNALYGMCVTDPCKNENIYANGIWEVSVVDIDKLIDKYNKNMNRVLYYPWGIWITAYARRNLFTGILEFGDDYIYSDTDSIKVINVDKHTKYIQEYNKQIIRKIYKCLDRYNIDRRMATPKTIEGKEKPLGVWEYEGEYTRFKTLGAKRYLTESYDKNGNLKLSITVAGVSKKNGIEYLKYKYKNNTEVFENFNDELYFPPTYYKDGKEFSGSGKLCHTYIDSPTEGIMIDYTGLEWIYKEMSSIHMDDTDYTLNLDSEYLKLITGIQLGHIAK